MSELMLAPFIFKIMCSLGFESLPIKSNPFTSRLLDYEATQTINSYFTRAHCSAEWGFAVALMSLNFQIRIPITLRISSVKEYTSKTYESFS